MNANAKFPTCTKPSIKSIIPVEKHICKCCKSNIFHKHQGPFKYMTGVFIKTDDMISLNWLLQVPVNNYHLARELKCRNHYHYSWCELQFRELLAASPLTKLTRKLRKWLSFFFFFLLACSFCNKEDKWVLAKKMATFGKHFFCIQLKPYIV